jgi:WD40 repeat protein
MKIFVDKTLTLRGHNDSVYNLQGDETHEEVYSSAGDGMIVRWDLREQAKGTVVAKFRNSVYAFHCMPGGRRLLAGHNYHGVHLIDLSEKRELASAAITSAPIFDIKAHDGRAFVATGDGQLIVLDVDDLSVVRKVQVSDKSLRTLAINAPAGEIAIGSSDNQIRILDLHSLTQKFRINAHRLSVFALVYSPDGAQLLSGSRDARIKVWDTATYGLHESIAAHMFAINDIVFSPDNGYFATCSMDKTIKIWDAVQFKLLKVIDKARHDGHTTSVNRLLWKHHGNALISCSDDRTIAAWHLHHNL